ncbi:hypothetical protein TURU_066695 [Turdus rufiventris]|nr:hypothetical protein TURU_066695 [Turdus rufiventris]
MSDQGRAADEEDEQAEEVSSRNGVPNLILTNRGGFVGDVEIGGNLGCSDHEIVEFSVRTITWLYALQERVLELNILQNRNCLSLSSCSLEEESFEEMHERDVIKPDLQFRKWVSDSSAAAFP